ncbi:MAG: GGDEF domain-containing protein [Pseudomonadales bacterium]|nr:GGDEF domain-containing protein [Pseudomonadales bacterium]MDG1442666.1 GGDEF domain-containing protein [Pseudomonadales bacterium]
MRSRFRQLLAQRTSEELMVMALGIICLCGLLPFAIIRFARGDIAIATIEAIGAVVTVGLLVSVYRSGRTEFTGLVLAMLSVFGISAVIYLGGITEVYFLYPTVIASYFLLAPNVALAVCIVAVFGLSPELYSRMEALEFGRFFSSMLACALFSYAFATIRNRQRDELFHLSTNDGLTGAGNRRAMDQKIAELIEGFKRNHSAVSMLMLDLDRFKVINDSQGHALGDQVLKEVTTVIKARIRTTDALFRYGGDEFVVLVPNSNLEHALGVAEDLRSLVEAHGAMNGTGVSISIGVAEYSQDQLPAEWLESADNALLEAKRNGRNQVLRGLNTDQKLD